MKETKPAFARLPADESQPRAVENLDGSDDGPNVTIIIPTFNQHEILHRCVESVLHKTTYLNFDVLIVDNGSDCPETLNYLQHVRTEPRVRTIRVPRSGEKFSFAAINNVAVKATEADYVLLLNNDTEVLEPRWLSRLMGYCGLPGVGVVGARLQYPDGSIQHADL